MQLFCTIYLNGANMNDKIRLHVQENNFTLKPDSVYQLHYETTEKMNHKTGEVQTTRKIQPISIKGIASFGINNFGLSVIFNPNKIMKKAPGVDLLTYTEFKESIEIVNDTFTSVGFDFDIRQAKITRYDTCFDLLTDEPYNAYAPLIKTMCPISKIRKARKQLFEDTLYLGNNSQVVTAYDKTTEDHLKDNVLRLEHRLLNIDSDVKFFIKDLTASKYKTLRTKSKKVIQDNLFNRNPVVCESEPLSFLASALNSDSNGSKIKTEFFNFVIATACIKLGVDVSIFLKEDRSNEQRYRRNNRILKEISNYCLVKNDELKNLLTELKTKFKLAQ